MRRQIVLSLVLCAALRFPAAGQVGPDTQLVTSVDSLQHTAQTAGRLAAGEPGVSAYFVSSLLGGIPAGLLLPIGIGTGESSYLGLGAAGTATIMVSTWSAARRDVEVPPAVLQGYRDRSPEYQRAFRAAYAEQLSRRRLRVSLLGGAIGAGIGLGTLLWLTSQVDDF